MATHKLAIVPACMLAMGLTACGGGGGGGGGSNDPTYNLTVLSNSVVEGNSGTSNLEFTVKSDSTASSDIAVSYAFTGGSATAGDDYVGQSGSVTIAAGSDQETLTIPVNGDTTVEADETIEITFTDPSGGKHLGTATITNDDLSAISIADASIVEGENGNVLQLTVTLDQPALSDVTVQYATSDGTAVAGADYTAASGNVSIPAGASSATVDVTINDDSEVELGEAFDVTLSSPTANATLADASATATINDNDQLGVPRVSINDVSIVEGDSGSKKLTFTVNLSTPSGGEVTIPYSTQDGTATAGADYVAVSSGTVVIPAGETSKDVEVDILGDTDVEHNETLNLVLGVATGDAVVLDGRNTGTGTIDNDDKSKISIGDVTVGEGAGNAVLTITLDQAGVSDISVSASTTDGSAAAGSDFTALSGETVTISAGQTSGNVSVPLIDDSDLDAGESFNVVLSSPSDNADIADGEGVATIVDNEQPAISVADASAGEADGSMTFTVSLSGAGEQDVTVSASTADNGSAVAGDDYTAVSAQSVTIPAGQTSATVTVSVSDDGVVEADETFTLSLSGAQNATISDGSATGTISSEDLPVVSIADASANEGDGTVTLTVSLDQPGVQDVTVDLVNNDGTALSGSDFNALVAGNTLTIPAGDSSATADVSLIDDAIAELDETFSAVISNPQNATLGTASSTITLSDNDTPTLSVGPAQVTEGNAGEVQLSFVVELKPAAPEPVSFNYSTSAGTATAGIAKAVEDIDYVETSGSAIIPIGATSFTVDVPVAGDVTLEADETLTLTLDTPSDNALIAVDGASAVGTISNDDTVTANSEDAQVTETDFGSAPLLFTVTLDAAADIPVDIEWSLTPGTAVAIDDYIDASGTLTIPAGDTSGQISVETVPEEWVEDDETLTLNLARVQTTVTVTTPTVIGTILNDDLPALSISSEEITEGASATSAPLTFTVSLTEAADADITVEVDTADDTATAGADYTTLGTTATILAGQLSTTVDVEVLGDDTAEFAETFDISLSNQSANAEIKFDGGTGTGTILNEDPPDLSIADGTGYEGSASSSNTVDLIVSTSVPALGETTVSYAATTEAGDNATAGVDYTAASGTATIAKDAMETVIRIPVSGDGELDVLAEKTFTVTLSAASANAVLTGATAQGTIIDDDDSNVPVTGFTNCGNATSNSLDCPVESHPMQDGNVGRGSFSFTKLDAAGADLPAEAASWACVRDDITGLIWEVKTTDGGLRDSANTYPWFNSSMYDPLDPGREPWAGTPGINQDPTVIENTEEFVAAVNASNAGAGLCGATDWRMPTVDELYGVANLGATSSPAVDTDFFPNAQGTAHWTSTSFRYLVEQQEGAWIVAFDNGHTSPMHKDTLLHVRLVRSGN